MSSPSSVPLLERIQRLSRLMRRLILVAILLDIGGVIALWASDYLVRASLLPGFGLSPEQVTLTLDVRLLGFLLSLPAAGIMLALLLESFHLFGDYGRGRIFTPAAIGRLGRLARGILLLAALQPVLHTLHVLVLTMHNPPGHRLLSVGVSSGELALAFLGGLLLAISWVMQEASRIATENSEFV